MKAIRIYQRTLHNQLCGTSTVTGITCVTPRILRVHVMNYKRCQCFHLFNVVFCTRTKTKFSFLPLQRNSRLRKLTVQADTVPFINHLTLKLFSEKNWSSWLTTRNNVDLQRKIKNDDDEIEWERNDTKETGGKRPPSYHLLWERLSL